MSRACLLWQGLQHGLQDGCVAAPKGFPLALDALTRALYIPVSFPPLLLCQGRPMALLVCACLSLTPPWLPLILQCSCRLSNTNYFNLAASRTAMSVYRCPR